MEQKPKNYNQSASQENEAAAAAILIEQAHAMRPGHRHNTLQRGESFVSTTLRQPLAETSHYGGNVSVGLTHLVMVGDSVLGVTHSRNTKKPGTGLEKVSVSLLPIGPHATKEGAAKLIGEVNVEDFAKPGPDGVVRTRQTIHLGRGTLAQLSGNTDPMVSGNHLAIHISQDGKVEFADSSTNGTQILENLDYDAVHTGLSEYGRGALATVAGVLQENPAVWDPEIGRLGGEQIRVINPDAPFA